jgi:hypothetical protein
MVVKSTRQLALTLERKVSRESCLRALLAAAEASTQRTRDDLNAIRPPALSRSTRKRVSRQK